MVFGCFFKDRLYESVFGGMGKRTAFCFKTQKSTAELLLREGFILFSLRSVVMGAVIRNSQWHEYHRFGDFLSGFYHVR